MTNEEKIDSIFGTVHELKPMVASCVDGLKTMDLRLRFLETRVEQHDVKVEHLERNHDGLAAKQRKLDSAIRGPLGPKSNDGFIITIGEFLIENWKLLSVLGVLGTGAIVTFYNFVVGLLHRLPTLPVPNVHH